MNKGKCSWEGCSEVNPDLVAELQTYRDDGRPHRKTQFCSLDHLACWAVNQGRREDLQRRSGPAKSKYLQLLEKKVLDIMQTHELDHVKSKSN